MNIIENNSDITSTPAPARPTLNSADWSVTNGLLRPRFVTTRPNYGFRGRLGAHRSLRSNDDAGLSDEQIRAVAPSVFAESANPNTTTDRYAFLSTATQLSALRNAGWRVAEVAESRVATLDRAGFQKHQLRLRHPGLKPFNKGEAVPEALLRNSHDGSCAGNLLLAAFRIVCSNGVIIADSTFGAVRFRHTGHSLVESVLEQSEQLVNRLPQVQDTLDQWGARVLTPAEQLELAVRAWQLRWDNDSTAPVRPSSLLARRRYDDATPSLWHTFNTVQENLLQGGSYDGSRSATGRRQRSRALTGVDAQRVVNTRLWELAAGFNAGTVTPGADVIQLVH
jgi:hypothetical protein